MILCFLKVLPEAVRFRTHSRTKLGINPAALTTSFLKKPITCVRKINAKFVLFDMQTIIFKRALL